MGYGAADKSGRVGMIRAAAVMVGLLFAAGAQAQSVTDLRDGRSGEIRFM